MCELGRGKTTCVRIIEEYQTAVDVVVAVADVILFYDRELLVDGRRTFLLSGCLLFSRSFFGCCWSSCEDKLTETLSGIVVVGT